MLLHIVQYQKSHNFGFKKKDPLKGSRDLITGLWRINLVQKEGQTGGNTARTQTQIYEANNVYDLSNP
jgi:hypothetical protein